MHLSDLRNAWRRNALAEELGHPLNWQTMDVEELRAMVYHRRGRPNRTQARPKPQPAPQPAQGTTEQGDTEQEATEQTQETRSEHSAESHREDKPDYSGQDE